MSMTTVTLEDLEEARVRLSSLLAEAARGEEVVIEGKDGSAFKLIPSGETTPGKKRGGLGIAKGQVWIADDFDEIPEGFEDYMP